MSKTKTETQDLQDQYWKSMTGMDCDKQKDWKSHGKQNDAQLSQRDRAAGCVIVFAKSRRLEVGDNILRTL